MVQRSGLFGRCEQAIVPAHNKAKGNGGGNGGGEGGWGAEGAPLVAAGAGTAAGEESGGGRTAPMFKHGMCVT